MTAKLGSGFTWRKRWAWLCSGHGPKSIGPAPPRPAGAQPRESADGPGKEYGSPTLALCVGIGCSELTLGAEEAGFWLPGAALGTSPAE